MDKILIYLASEIKLHGKNIHIATVVDVPVVTRTELVTGFSLANFPDAEDIQHQ